MKSVSSYIAIFINIIITISMYSLPTYTREFKQHWESEYTVFSGSWYDCVDGTGLYFLSFFPIMVTIFFIVSCLIIVISKKKGLTLIAQLTPTLLYLFGNIITVSQMRNVSNSSFQDHNHWNGYMYVTLILLFVAFIILLFSKSSGFVTEKIITINENGKKVDIETVKQYQELLNEGIITQEEFDKKRKELLDI